MMRIIYPAVYSIIDNIMKNRSDAIEIDENDARLLCKSANIYTGEHQGKMATVFMKIKLFDFRDAIRDAEMAMPYSPIPWFDWSIIGSLYYISGDTRKSIDSFLNALEIDSRCFLALRDYAEVCYCIGKIEDAETLLRVSLSHSANDPRALFLLGRVYLDRGKYEKGLECLRMAAKGKSSFYKKNSLDLMRDFSERLR